MLTKIVKQSDGSFLAYDPVEAFFAFLKLILFLFSLYPLVPLAELASDVITVLGYDVFVYEKIQTCVVWGFLGLYITTRIITHTHCKEHGSFTFYLNEFLAIVAFFIPYLVMTKLIGISFVDHPLIVSIPSVSLAFLSLVFFTYIGQDEVLDAAGDQKELECIENTPE